MGYIQTQSNKRFMAGLSAFLALMLFYFLFHLFFSERSIPTLLSADMRLERLHSQLAQTDAEHEYMQDRVIRMRPNSLDMDLVEERTLLMLGTRRDQDVIALR